MNARDPAETTITDALRREVGLLHLLQAVAAAANEAATVEQAMRACRDAVCAHTGWPVGHAYVTQAELAAAPDAPLETRLVTTRVWHLADPATASVPSAASPRVRSSLPRRGCPGES